jgi:hypothetical protein
VFSGVYLVLECLLEFTQVAKRDLDMDRLQAGTWTSFGQVSRTQTGCRPPSYWDADPG